MAENTKTVWSTVLKVVAKILTLIAAALAGGAVEASTNFISNL